MIKKYLNIPNFFLIAILGLAFFLRSTDLSRESIWFDEGFSIATANQKSIGELVRFTAQDTHPPAYYVMLYYWIKLFGDSQYSARFLSSILGTIAVFLIFFAGKLLFNLRTGIFAAFIMAITRFQIEYSREIRGYVLMVTLALLSYCILAKMEKKKNTGLKIAYIITSAILLYTHVYAIFIIVAHNIYKIIVCLKQNRKGIAEWIILQFILIILYLPWFLVIKNQFGIVKKGFWISKPEDWRILETFLHFSVSPTGLIILVLLSAFVFVGVRKVRSGKDVLYQAELALSDSDKICMLVLWLLAPVLVPFCLSFFITPIYYYRYALAAAPAFYLLCARGLDNIKIRYIQITAISVIIILSYFNLKPYFSEYQKPRWEDASKYLANNIMKNDIAIFSMGLGKPFIFDYYCPKIMINADYLPSSSINFLNIERYHISIDDAISLKNKIHGYRGVWIVLYLNTNPNMIIERTMQYLEYKLIEIKDFSSTRPRELTDTLRIYRFDKIPNR